MLMHTTRTYMVIGSRPSLAFGKFEIPFGSILISKKLGHRLNHVTHSMIREIHFAWKPIFPLPELSLFK